MELYKIETKYTIERIEIILDQELSAFRKRKLFGVIAFPCAFAILLIIVCRYTDHSTIGLHIGLLAFSVLASIHMMRAEDIRRRRYHNIFRPNNKDRVLSVEIGANMITVSEYAKNGENVEHSQRQYMVDEIVRIKEYAPYILIVFKKRRGLVLFKDDFVSGDPNTLASFLGIQLSLARPSVWSAS